MLCDNTRSETFTHMNQIIFNYSVHGPSYGGFWIFNRVMGLLVRSCLMNPGLVEIATYRVFGRVGLMWWRSLVGRSTNFLYSRSLFKSPQSSPTNLWPSLTQRCPLSSDKRNEELTIPEPLHLSSNPFSLNTMDNLNNFFSYFFIFIFPQRSYISVFGGD